MVTEVAEHPVGRDVVQHLHREPVVEEHIDPRPVQPTLRYELTPVVGVQWLPVLAVEILDASPLVLGNLEHQVLHEIRGKQRRAPVVERLEDNLRVVTWLQVDHDEPKVVPQRADKRVEPCGHLVRVTGDIAPFGDSVEEEGVRLHDPRCGENGRHDGVVVHRGAERVLVAVGRPDLVDLILVLSDRRIVQHEHLQRLRVHRHAVLLDYPLCRVEQQLQRRQPLLTVNDVTDFGCWSSTIAPRKCGPVGPTLGGRTVAERPPAVYPYQI